jgi:chemotaxis signal transduction protein
MSSESQDANPEVDLLLFEIGTAVYGAEASQVVRVDNPTKDAVTLAELGTLKHGGRALVFQADGGEGQLRIDGVRGVKTVGVHELRRLPPAVAVKPYALGIWLDGQQTVLLIDLQEAAKRKVRGHGNAERQR